MSAMTRAALVRPIGNVFWELREAWASGRRISVTLSGADRDRVEGFVEHVSATQARVKVGGIYVLADCITGVHRPSMLADSTASLRERFDADARDRFPQREQIPGMEAW